jgi:hypothetical protein
LPAVGSDLTGHHREPGSRLSGPGRFHRGVKRQQIGLEGYLVVLIKKLELFNRRVKKGGGKNGKGKPGTRLDASHHQWKVIPNSRPSPIHETPFPL